MSEDKPYLPLIVAFVLFLAFAFVSGMDFEDELVRDAMRKDPPRILSYTIKQDSPGLDRGVPMFPLHQPVAHRDTK